MLNHNINSAAVAALLLWICTYPITLPAAVINTQAPEFTLNNSLGKQTSLQDYRGKIVVLEWTNHDCPFVRKHYTNGAMQELQKHSADKGIVWLSIISSAPGKQGYVSANEAQQLTSSRNAFPSAVLIDPDGEVGRLYKAKTTPHMYVIDSNGILRYAGAIDSINSTNTEDVSKAENYVEKALSELLAGKQVSTSTTTPYGCSVKY